MFALICHDVILVWGTHLVLHDVRYVWICCIHCFGLSFHGKNSIITDQLLRFPHAFRSSRSHGSLYYVIGFLGYFMGTPNPLSLGGTGGVNEFTRSLMSLESYQVHWGVPHNKRPLIYTRE